MGWAAWSVDKPNLRALCERRIDRPVLAPFSAPRELRKTGLAVAFIRALENPRPPEYVIALSDDGNLWWLEILPGRGVGGGKSKFALADEVVDIQSRRRGRWQLELCGRHDWRLHQAVVYGRTAERFALALEEFAPRHTVRA